MAYTNQLSKATLFLYDALGRKIAETNANLEVTQYGYDAAGDLLTLTDGKSQTTTWNYDQFGRATNKIDAASNIILAYNYDADSRVTNRYSISKGNKNYSYDAVGNLTNVSYNVSPSISMAYDANNRLTKMVDGVGTTSYSYDGLGELLSEGGLWNNDAVNYTVQQPFACGSGYPAAQCQFPGAQTYGYDGANRLTSTVSPAGAFTYTYDATRNAHVSNLLLPNTSYITNTYDNVARLLSTKLINSSNTILGSYTYSNNVGNQRTQQVFTGGNFVNYTYDSIGQLTSELGKESGGGNQPFAGTIEICVRQGAQLELPHQQCPGADLQRQIP